MDIATNEYGLERLFDDGASSSLPTAVDAALPAPAEKHDLSDAEEFIPLQLSFKGGKAYGRHHDRKMLNDNSGCKPKVHSHTRGAFSHLLPLVMLHIELRSLVL